MYIPAREFIDSFKAGEIIRPLEFAKSFTPEMTESNKAKQLCLFHEIAERELLRFNAFEFYKPLSSEAEFIKKINEDYNEFRVKDYVCYAYYVDRWIECIPDNCFFTVDDIWSFIPGPKPADSTIKNYLNKAANEGKLLKYTTDKGRYYFKDSKVAEKTTPKVAEENYNEIQQLFIDFLKKGKAFDKFKENLGKTLRFEDSEDPIKDMLTASIRPVYWLSETIIWRETSEGFEFWEKTHYSWLLTLVSHFRPKIKTALEILINSDNDLKRYFTTYLNDIAGDLLFKEGWDLTKCTALI